MVRPVPLMDHAIVPNYQEGLRVRGGKAILQIVERPPGDGLALGRSCLPVECPRHPDASRRRHSSNHDNNGADATERGAQCDPPRTSIIVPNAHLTEGKWSFVHARLGRTLIYALRTWTRCPRLS